MPVQQYDYVAFLFKFQAQTRIRIGTLIAMNLQILIYKHLNDFVAEKKEECSNEIEFGFNTRTALSAHR